MTAAPASLRAAVLGILAPEEGRRLVVYDDATGKPLRPGMMLVGHPTIGTGRALDTRGISEAEADALLARDVEDMLGAVPGIVPGWSRLSVARQAVLVCMAFQMGMRGLAGFRGMLAAIGRGDFPAAAAAMLDSKWARQTPGRAARMAEQMRAG